jgi:hypothetical protein
LGGVVNVENDKIKEVFYVESIDPQTDCWVRCTPYTQSLDLVKKTFAELSNNGTEPGYRIRYEKQEHRIMFQSGPAFEHYRFY